MESKNKWKKGKLINTKHVNCKVEHILKFLQEINAMINYRFMKSVMTYELLSVFI